MKKVVMLVAVMLVASGVVYSQAFKVTSVGGNLGVHGLLGPEGATEVVSKGGAGMGFGPFLGVGGRLRASMASMPKIRWAAGVRYDIFQGAGGTPETKITQGILGIGLGAEYPLKAMKMGAKEMWPYVGGEIQVNVYPAATIDPAIAGYTPNSGTRIGIGLGGGVEYPLTPKMNLDVGLKLSIANLLGKGSTATDALYQSSVTSTSIEEGTWMHLSLTIGVNWSLGSMMSGEGM
ncbi:MAG: outer membrane beta-barrel protein [Ignavibacteriales bacterium]|nr:outer membrane beta-barrel protein [Ignavibacteriales bacterium]